MNDDVAATFRDLVARIAEGDQNAFENFYDLTACDVLGITASILRDRSHAEEVVQEVYLELWREARRLDPDRPAERLLHQMARRRAIDRRRSVQADREQDHSHDARRSGSYSGDVAEYAEIHLTYAPVADAIRALPRIHNNVLFLAYVRGLSHSEIAAELQVPLGTVKTRLRDSIRRLRTSDDGNEIAR